MSDPEDLSYADALVALHQLVVTEENLTDSLRRVATIARFAIPGVEAVGLTLRAGQSGTTVAHDGDVAIALDEAQYQDDLGPCLEAFRTDQMLLVGRIADELSRWPAFARRAEELGIRSSLSVPMRSEGTPVGALNLYASPESAFGPESVVVAELFGAQASVSVTNAEVYWRAKHLADHLGRALESRDRIGQAKGILMREHGIDADKAFELIRQHSQDRNVKVADLADQIIWTGQLPEAD